MVRVLGIFPNKRFLLFVRQMAVLAILESVTSYCQILRHAVGIIFRYSMYFPCKKIFKKSAQQCLLTGQRAVQWKSRVLKSFYLTVEFLGSRITPPFELEVNTDHRGTHIVPLGRFFLKFFCNEINSPLHLRSSCHIGAKFQKKILFQGLHFYGIYYIINLVVFICFLYIFKS